MGKLLFLILLGAALWFGWDMHTKARDQGAGAPSASQALPPGKEALAARPTRLSPAAQVAPIPGVD